MTHTLNKNYKIKDGYDAKQDKPFWTLIYTSTDGQQATQEVFYKRSACIEAYIHYRLNEKKQANPNINDQKLKKFEENIRNVLKSANMDTEQVDKPAPSASVEQTNESGVLRFETAEARKLDKEMARKKYLYQLLEDARIQPLDEFVTHCNVNGNDITWTICILRPWGDELHKFTYATASNKRKVMSMLYNLLDAQQLVYKDISFTEKFWGDQSTAVENQIKGIGTVPKPDIESIDTWANSKPTVHTMEKWYNRERYLMWKDKKDQKTSA